MAFKLNKEIATSLVTDTGVSLGVQTTTVGVTFAVESISINASGAAFIYLTSKLPGGPVENAGNYQFEINTSSGISPILQAEFYLRSLPEFSSAESV